MLEEGNQSRGNTHNLVGSNIHEIDIFVVIDGELVVVAAGVAANELVVFVQRRIRLGNDVFIFCVSREEYVLFGNERTHQDVLNAKFVDFLRHFLGDTRLGLVKNLTSGRVNNILA